MDADLSERSRLSNMAEPAAPTLIAALAIAATPSLAADPGFYLTASIGQSEESPSSRGLAFSVGFPTTGRRQLEPTSVAIDDGDVAGDSLLAGRTELERVSLSVAFAF